MRDYAVLSRRLLLQAGAAAFMLAPQSPVLAQAPAPGKIRLDPLADAGVHAALLVHSPGLRPRRPAGWAPRCWHAQGLVPLALGTGLGLRRCDDALARVTEQGGHGPLGLVVWGDVASRPEIAALSEEATAMVLIDQIDPCGAARQASGRRMLCHFATALGAPDRRAIDRSLAAVARTGTPLTCHWYDAAPGFAAPGQRLSAAANLVWQRTAAFLAQPEGDGLPCAAAGDARA